MQKNEIIYTPFAYLCLEKILFYIGNNSKTRAEQFILDLKNKVNNLKLYPNLGKQIISNKYIYLIHKNYFIIYKIEKNIIYIIAINHVKNKEK